MVSSSVSTGYELGVRCCAGVAAAMKILIERIFPHKALNQSEMVNPRGSAEGQSSRNTR